MKKSNVVGNGIDMGQLLEFEVAFPGEKPLPPEEYLKGGRKDLILNVAAAFLGMKGHNSRYADNRVLLETIFSPVNNDFANKVYSQVRAVERKGIRLGVVNAYSSLSLFEYFFNANRQGEVTQSPEEFERNFFKCYLLFNDDFIKKQQVAFDSTNDVGDDLKVAVMAFCMHYPVSDKINYDIRQIWVTQTIKAIYLFEFLESDPRLQPLLAAFLKYFECPTWQYYLKSLLPLTLSALQQKKEAHTDIVVEPGEKFAEGCAFLDKLVIPENEELLENDFLTLRAKPFYKVKEGCYRIIFNLFVVEKIFKGVYFLLRDVNEKLPRPQRITELKSVYGKEFSEENLLYRVMGTIYPENCVRFTGKQLEDMHIDGAPDYYLRKNKHVLLLESKDFLIRADKKASFDYQIYEQEFKQVLYYKELPNGSQKPKAVLQLINNVRRMLVKDLAADKNYHYKDIFIYPMLITHDHQYDTPGFNEWINYWFQQELRALQDEGLFIHRVRPLVVVNIDSLIYHQVGLVKDCRLHELLQHYAEQVSINQNMKFRTFEELKEYRMSKLMPFDQFIGKYFYQKGIGAMPPILDVVAPFLFKEEWEKRKDQ